MRTSQADCRGRFWKFAGPKGRLMGAVGAGCVGVVWAEPAGLDEGFGTAGMVTTPLSSSPSGAGAHGVAIQPDGNIVVGGYGSSGPDLDFAVVRYGTDGILNTSFNASGKVLVPINQAAQEEDRGRAITLQADGKIVIAGSVYNGSNYDFAVVRLLADGTLDSGFGAAGRVIVTFGTGNEHARGVAVQSDGRIVVAGFARIGSTDDIAVARLSENGTLDTSFGGDGKVTTGTTASHDYGLGVALRSGKVLVGGYGRNIGTGVEYFALTRYTSTGALDSTFNGSGIVVTSIGGIEDRIHALAIQGTPPKLIRHCREHGGSYDRRN